MTFKAHTRSALAGLGIAAAALVPSGAALAQETGEIAEPMSAEEVRILPTDLRTGPVTHPVSDEVTETIVDEDGVEVITRTRRIPSAATYSAATAPTYGAPTQPVTYRQGYAPASLPAYVYAPGAQVFERAQWLEECERRTSGRSDREKGGIIGGLLGAIAGGVIGNRVWDSERLLGTIVGAGTGGLAGAVLGGLIGGGRDEDGDYDCAAALDSYLSQYGGPTTRIASRTIPAPGGYAAPAYSAPAYRYGYAPAYPSYGYAYAPPQQVVYVPVPYEQQQRVIVRETVREEAVPGSRRVIPAPAPRMIKQSEPRPIKGN